MQNAGNEPNTPNYQGVWLKGFATGYRRQLTVRQTIAQAETESCSALLKLPSQASHGLALTVGPDRKREGAEEHKYGDDKQHSWLKKDAQPNYTKH
jgi:hypothetical protein